MKSKKIPIPKKIQRFSSRFHDNGFSLYIVGGAVRDYVAGFPVKDYDFTTDAEPQQVIRLFRHTIPTGIQHGTVTVLFEGEPYEVTTFRSESDYSDSRRPDGVSFLGSIDEDLSRRDFTINALAADTSSGVLIDNHEGLIDLKQGIIRAIGDPVTRFTEDALRMLRAFRFSAQLGFTIEEQTLSAIRVCAKRITKISKERIQDELNKILAADRPSSAFLEMEKSRLLDVILPELTACRGVGSKGPGAIDTFTHLCLCCDGVDAQNPKVRMAALLHDIGKPDTEKSDAQGNTIFHGHDKVSAVMADALLKELKYSNEFRESVVHLIEEHMFNYTSSWSDGAVRKFVHRVGVSYIEDLILLRRADNFGSSGVIGRKDPLLDELKERIRKILAEQNALTLKDLALNGKDLIETGMKPGPQLGVLLNLLLDAVLEDPRLNEKERLLAIAKKMTASYHLD